MTEPVDPFARPRQETRPPADPFARRPAGGATAGVGSGGTVDTGTGYADDLRRADEANRAANAADTAHDPISIFTQGTRSRTAAAVAQIQHSGDYRQGMTPDQPADLGQVAQSWLDIGSGLFGMVAAPVASAIDALGGRATERALNLHPGGIGDASVTVGSFFVPGAAETPRVRRPLPGYVEDAYTDPARPWHFRDTAEAQAQFHAREQSTEPGGPGAGAPPPQPDTPAAQPERVYEPRIVANAQIGTDGRFVTDADGNVAHAAAPGVEPAPEGPLTFRRPGDAARWIIQNGQRHSVDQMFELANGREPGTYVIRERARAPQPPEPLDFVTPTDTFPEPPPEPAPEPAGAPPGGGEPPGGTSEPPPAGEPPDASGAAPAPLEFVQPVRPRQWHDAITRPILEKGIPQAVTDWLAHFYTGFAASAHPLTRSVEELRSQIEGITGKPMDIPASRDPRGLVRVGADVFSLGHQDLVDGVWPYRGTGPASPAMQDVVVALTARAVRNGITPAEMLKRFNDYLTARRGVEEWGRFERGEIENPPLPAAKGGDRASLEAHIQRAESAHPHFAPLAAEVNEIGRALWTKQFDAGLIGQETYLAANAARNFYVPFRRVMEDGPHVGTGAGTNAASMAKKFGGSERDVIGPLETMARQTYEVSRRIRQNEINLGLINLAEQLDRLLPEGEANGVMRKLPTPSHAVTATPEELKAFGIDHLFTDENLTLWRPGDKPDKGRPILYAWRNGKREAWELLDPEWGRDLYNAMTGMTQVQADYLTQLLQVPAKALRKGVTAHPAFTIANFIRDQIGAWITTGLIVPGEGARGVADELTKARTGTEYAAMGGQSPGAAGARVADVAARQDLLALRTTGLRARYAANLGSVFNIPDISEVGTRLALFRAAKRRALNAGLSELDALHEAAVAARDFLDFGRYGSRMHAALKAIPFLNGSLQGVDKAVRAALGEPLAVAGRQGVARLLAPLFEDAPAGFRREDAAAVRTAAKLWAKIAALSVLSAGVTALYSDDPEYQNIPEYQRASNWYFRMFGRWIAVPKPYELAAPMNIAERGYEAAHFGDPTAWSRMGQDLMNNVALPSDNPFIRTSAELLSNTNFRTGGQIVPDTRLAMEPEDQSNAYTSMLGHWLGEHSHTSPAKIDFAIRGFGGSYGSSLLNFSNITDPDRPAGTMQDDPLTRRFVTDPFRGAQDESNFFDRVGGRTSELMRRFNSIHEATLNGNSSRAESLFSQADPAGQVWLTTQMAENPAVRRLNPLERARVAVLEIDRMTRELYGDRTRDSAAPLPPMTPAEKGQVRDALGRLAVVETRNAMIATGQPGYLNRAPMNRDDVVRELDAIHPGLAAELETRIRTGRDKAYGYDAVQRVWPQVEARIRASGRNANLTDLVGEVAR